MSSLKIFRTSRTQVSSLPSFKVVKPKPKEAEVRKREVTVVESGLGDIFKDFYEKPKADVKPDEISPIISYKSEKSKEDEVSKEEVVVVESGLGDIFKDLYEKPREDVKPDEISPIISYKSEKTKEDEVSKEEVVVEESGLGDIFKDLYEKPKADVKPDEISPISYKSEKSKEDEVSKEQVTVVESGLGDIFQDLYGESETEVKPDEKPNTKEAEVSKEEVTVEESGLGDIFQDLYGESDTAVKPGEISATSASKPHVPEDRFPKQDEPPNKKQYGGTKVREGVVSTNVAEVESSDLDDLISQVMDIPADENPQLSSGPKPNTSTPSKDYEDDADFGDVLSLIRGDDDEDPEVPAGQANQRETEEDENRNRRSEDRDETSGKPMAYRDSTKPSSDGRSTITSTTSTISYSSKFVPNIPESFYKDMQSRLEDLIFKFECLDNEYAALQKISHRVHEETLECKKKCSS